MAQLVKLLDVAGRPNQVINCDQVLSVSDKNDPEDPSAAVIVHLRGDAKRVGNTFDEVIDIINAGVTPDYELNENGVVVGFVDPRFKAQREKERLSLLAEKQAAAKQAAEDRAAGIVTAGFGAKVVAENASETSEEAVSDVSEDDKGKLSYADLKDAKTAKTAFGKHK